MILQASPPAAAFDSDYSDSSSSDDEDPNFRLHFMAGAALPLPVGPDVRAVACQSVPTLLKMARPHLLATASLSDLKLPIPSALSVSTSPEPGLPAPGPAHHRTIRSTASDPSLNLGGPASQSSVPTAKPSTKRRRTAGKPPKPSARLVISKPSPVSSSDPDVEQLHQADARNCGPP